MIDWKFRSFWRASERSLVKWVFNNWNKEFDVCESISVHLQTLLIIRLSIKQSVTRREWVGSRLFNKNSALLRPLISTHILKAPIQQGEISIHRFHVFLQTGIFHMTNEWMLPFREVLKIFLVPGIFPLRIVYHLISTSSRWQNRF